MIHLLVFYTSSKLLIIFCYSSSSGFPFDHLLRYKTILHSRIFILFNLPCAFSEKMLNIADIPGRDNSGIRVEVILDEKTELRADRFGFGIHHSQRSDDEIMNVAGETVCVKFQLTADIILGRPFVNQNAFKYLKQSAGEQGSRVSRPSVPNFIFQTNDNDK